MGSKYPFDPAGVLRDMLGEWEKMANSLGGDALKTEEFARTMNGAQMAGSTLQAQFRDHMDRALEQSNLPTRRDIEAIDVRLTAIEATLARIEKALGTGTARSRPKPTRTRKPPAAAQD